jgi:hypothetical protein
VNGPNWPTVNDCVRIMMRDSSGSLAHSGESDWRQWRCSLKLPSYSSHDRAAEVSAALKAQETDCSTILPGRTEISACPQTVGMWYRDRIEFEWDGCPGVKALQAAGQVYRPTLSSVYVAPNHTFVLASFDVREV